MDKVGLVDVLTKDKLEQAVQQQISAVVTNAVKVASTSIPQGFAVFDANEGNRDIVSWYVYDRNLAIATAIKSIFPQLFAYKGYDLTNAILKYLFWAVQGSATALPEAFHAYEKRFPGEYEVIPLDKQSPLALLKQYARLFDFWLRSAKGVKKSQPAVHLASDYPKASYLIVVDSPLLVMIWDKLIQEFDPEETLILLYPNERAFWPDFDAVADTIANWEQLGFRISRLDARASYRDAFSSVMPAKVKPAHAEVTKLILSKQGHFQSFIDSFEQVISHVSPKIVLVNAAENTWEGHLYCQLAAQKGFKVVNSMNGTKDAGANNARTEFDLWLVWDERMQKILVEGCDLPARQLYNGRGHLMQDVLAEHKYSGTLDPLLAGFHQPEIISFCSIAGTPLNKVRVLDAIYELLLQRPELLVLYRPHPAEKEIDYYLPETAELRKRVRVVRYDKSTIRKTLFDQFLLSDIVIVTGSTVGIEATWAGTPAITFEEKPTSSLYCVDGKTLFHERSAEAVKARILTILEQDLKKKMDKQLGTVAGRYANIIKDLAGDKLFIAEKTE